MRYWKVISAEVAEQIQDWHKARRKGNMALVRLRKKVGAEHLGIKHGSFCGVPYSIGFHFSGHPDPEFFTKKDSDGYSRIKRPRVKHEKNGPTLLKMQEDAIRLFKSYEPITKALRIKEKQIHGLSLWHPQFLTKSGDWYVVTADNYEGCEHVERISDIAMEQLFPSGKKRSKP